MHGCKDWVFGGFCGGVTPGSMPNPAVKPSSADGTPGGTRGRVGRCRKPYKTDGGRFFQDLPPSVVLGTDLAGLSGCGGVSSGG